MEHYSDLILTKDEHRRILAGHLWIFSNEIDTERSPLKAFTAGQIVRVISAQGRSLGFAHVNPNNLICARLLTRDVGITPDALLAARLAEALALREQWYSKPYYRLVYGESDGLPGLVVDRFGSVLVVQLNTAGMDTKRGVIIDALRRSINPDTIVLRNDSPARIQEGLVAAVEIVHGALDTPCKVYEHGAEFTVDVLEGQKTGWFYDQYDNRGRIQPLVKGARVLDLFSYTGAWGIQAAVAGAAEVYCVDESPRALAGVTANAALNSVSERVFAVQKDGFDFVKQNHDPFDLVVLDPPALIKKRKDVPKGVQAYLSLNVHALKHVKPGGLLVTCSCSYHLQRETFRTLLVQAARKAHVRIQCLVEGGQAPDHPVLPAMLETDYLKVSFLRVLGH